MFSFVFLTLDPLRTRQWQLKTLWLIKTLIFWLHFTVTWLRPGIIDDVEIRTLCPTGYRFLHVPRVHSRGGGVGLLFKDTLQINSHITDTFTTFELMDIHFRSLQSIRVLLIYRPPDNTSCVLFLEEFSVLLEQIMAESTGHLLISGDFNLHVDDPCSIYANRFNEILESCNLKQHVTGATHANGHTLDLVISKKDNPLITEIKIFNPVISDHCAVHCNLRIQKLHFTKKKLYYRKLRSLDIESFCADNLTSPLLQDQAVELNALVDQYDNVLRSLLDLYAPLKRRTVTLRPSAPWYKPEVVVQKNIRRRLERKWRSTRLLCDREQYVHQCYVVNNLIESLKSTYYTDIINEHSSDQRILFKTVGKLLQKSTNKRYPPSSDDTALANSFADFFTSKIDKIHQGLVERKIRVGSSPPDVKVCGTEFCNFAEVTLEEIKIVFKETTI